MTRSFALRPARPNDIPEILTLIRELAEYERLLDQVTATQAGLHTALFGERPSAEVILAEVEGALAGFALFFMNFSTFVGKPGIYLEDLFVRPSFRRLGIGRAVFHYLARQAVERGCGRLEWSVLNWNEPAWAFYRTLGAVPMSEWTIHRLSGEALTKLAVEGAG